MKHRLTDLFITQAGLIYCAVRGEYSIFFFLYFHASPISCCLLLWRRQRVKALSCLAASRGRTAVLARIQNHRFILHVDTGCPACRFSRFHVLCKPLITLDFLSVRLPTTYKLRNPTTFKHNAFEFALSSSQPFTKSRCDFLTTVESARFPKCCFSDPNCIVAGFV